MKKIFLTLLLILTLSGAALGASPVMDTSVIWSAEAIAGSANVTSTGIWDMSALSGLASIQYVFTGAGGTLTLECLESNDGITYYSTVTIVTSAAVGGDLLEIFPKFGRYIKIKATETAGNPIVLSATLTIR